MASALPDERIQNLVQLIQCRQIQIQQLSCLLGPSFPSPPTLILHGPEATGKSLVINTLLQEIHTPSAVVKCQECITTRHLLERTLSGIRDALEHASRGPKTVDGRCESISAFAAQLHRLLAEREKFILVFENIDRQREAIPTLFPALARLGELNPSLTTLLTLTSPSPRLFHHPGIPHIYFPPYTRSELLLLVANDPLPLEYPPNTSPPPNAPTFTDEDLAYLWPRFTTAVHDSLSKPADHSLPALKELCRRLWPPFIVPVLQGLYSPREVSKLLVRNRYLLQDESALLDSIIPLPLPPHATAAAITTTPSSSKLTKSTHHPSITLPKKNEPHPSLPRLPSQLLISTYLASYTPPKNDTLLFSKSSSSSKKKRRRQHNNPTTPQKPNSHRKLSQHLLGPQSFPLERLWAIHAALFGYEGRGRRKGGGAEALMQWATLGRLRLVAKAGGVGGGEGLEGGKWRVAVGAGYVREVARGLRFDLGEYVTE